MENFVRLTPDVAVNPYAVEVIYVDGDEVVVRTTSGHEIEMPHPSTADTTAARQYQNVVNRLDEARSPAGYIRVGAPMAKAEIDAAIKRVLAGTGYHATLTKSKES